MKKSFIILSIIAIVILVCAGCGSPGIVNLKYWWTGELKYIYDTNPSTPSIIYCDVYFETQPGDYYLEYTSWDNSNWWMTYTLDPAPKGFLSAGPNLYYEIGLYSTGPVLYFWADNPKSLTPKSEKRPMPIESGILP